ncbi:MAG: DUF58 domain-containing protein [Pseudomonadota bacterium]
MTLIADNAPAQVRISQTDLIALRHTASQLPLEALRVRARKGGQYLSHFKGRGMEFDEARLYQPGDDPRNIDWRVTARTGRAYTKLFREERERPVFCWVDQRSTMQFATRGVYKSVQAARLSVLLAWAAVARGDRLGAFVFNDTQRAELRPMLGKRAVLRFIHQLADLQQREPPVTLDNGDLLQRTLAGLRRVAHPGSLVVLVSDFAGFNAAAGAHLSGIARHNDVLVLSVHDPLERQLPPPGEYAVQVAEQRLSLVSNARSQQRWQRDWQQQQRELKGLCERNRIRFESVSTMATPLDVLQTLLGKAV